MDAGKVILIILDGWGIAENPEVSAIDAAQTPFYDSLLKNHPNTQLRASEQWVGLPKGQMGNSEVGHINIGAGRTVFQELERITNALEDPDFAQNSVFKNLVKYAKQNGKPIHLMGLLSEGGVHSHIRHLEKLITHLKAEGVSQLFIHAFTDGRDCDPKSGLGFIKNLQLHLNDTVGKIATVSGRYYAMDRDKRWERVKLA